MTFYRSHFHRQMPCLRVSILSLLYVPRICISTNCDEGVCQAASGVTSSYGALLELFECLGSFIKRLEIYTTIPPTPILTEVIVKIMIELLSMLALSMKQIKRGRFSKCAIVSHYVLLPSSTLYCRRTAAMGSSALALSP
jgi:hypothetical protein